METIQKLVEKAGRWYENYVASALEPRQAKFWLLFWGSVIASCAIFYVYTFYVSDRLSRLEQTYSTTLVTDGCVLLPALVLRRLLPWGFLFLYSFFMRWLGLQDLALWLPILFGLIYLKRRRINHPQNN